MSSKKPVHDSRLVRKYEKEIEGYIKPSLESSQTPYKNNPKTDQKDEVKKHINFSFDDNNKENTNVQNSQANTDLFNRICEADSPEGQNPNISKVPNTAVQTSDSKFCTEIKKLMTQNLHPPKEFGTEKKTRNENGIVDIQVPELSDLHYGEEISERLHPSQKSSQNLKFDIFQEGNDLSSCSGRTPQAFTYFDLKRAQDEDE